MSPLRENPPLTERIGAYPQDGRTQSPGCSPAVAVDWDDDCRRFINNHQWINFREGATSAEDQLVIVDAATGARIVVHHESWSALVSAARYFNDVHCEVAGCGDEPTP
jgi:hypothetical protein